MVPTFINIPLFVGFQGFTIFGMSGFLWPVIAEICVTPSPAHGPLFISISTIFTAIFIVAVGQVGIEISAIGINLQEKLSFKWVLLIIKLAYAKIKLISTPITSLQVGQNLPSQKVIFTYFNHWLCKWLCANYLQVT